MSTRNLIRRTLKLETVGGSLSADAIRLAHTAWSKDGKVPEDPALREFVFKLAKFREEADLSVCGSDPLSVRAQRCVAEIERIETAFGLGEYANGISR
jgi:hypothetical protein